MDEYDNGGALVLNVVEISKSYPRQSQQLLKDKVMGMNRRIIQAGLGCLLCMVSITFCAGQVWAAAKNNKAERERLAVLDLEATYGIEEGLAKGLSVIVRDTIHGSGKYVVMSQEDIRAVASREQLLQAMGCDESNGQCLVDFGKTIGTRFMVAGTISKIGTTYTVSLRMLDTKGGNAGLLNRVNEECKCDEDTLVQTVKKVAAELVGDEIADTEAPKEEAARKTQASLAEERRRAEEEKMKFGPQEDAAKLAGAANTDSKQLGSITSGRTANKPTKTFTDPTTGMEFVLVPGGCFQMGSPSSEKDRGNDEGPVHEVCVDSFYLGKYEVTNHQFWLFRSRHDSKEFKGNSLDGEQQPVVFVSWQDASDYAQWLSDSGGRSFRLPTEAEWEYAARGGRATSRYWGDDPDSACRYANVHDRTSKNVNGFEWQNHNCDDGHAVTAPVGSFQPNDFGLYDMLGNVWEWTADWYGNDYYGNSPRQNPTGPLTGSSRVGRGGGWSTWPSFMRAADRRGFRPDVAEFHLGFRLALPVQPQ